ncbi:ABC transporter permease [Chryseolinea sp. T2]|uniref:ABC transporter permease n=1 Tax=Chryseolinea sp. T2 TaxID=3129255 RepID=UPI0030787B9B
MITDEHIAYISRDLHYRGIVEEHIQHEMLDHLCEQVDANMTKGQRFIDAYEAALISLGYSEGLLKTQSLIIKSEHSNSLTMLHNYVTVALRNLSRQKIYTLINVFGLAVGLAACLVIGLYIVQEFQFDSHHEYADRIYRIDAHAKIGVNEFDMTYRSAVEAKDLQETFEEIEATVRFRQMGSYLVKTAEGNDNVKESNVIWSEGTFFKVFSVPVLEGNAATALSQPHGVAISKRMADKYYSGKSAVGQPIILDNARYGIVSAVFEDMPATSHFHFDIIIAFNGDWPIAREAASTDYLTENFITYILLKPGADARALGEKLPRFIKQHVGDALARAMGGDFSFDKFLEQGNRYSITLRPLRDIHLHSNLKGEFEPNGSISYVYVIAAVGIVILLIACINFVNLSTARANTRAREVGIRKAMGSLRIHLIRQFLTESLLVSSAGFLIALIMAWLFLPWFNHLAQRDLNIPWASATFIVIILMSTISVGVVAGLYPAFVLSAFNPAKVLKGERIRTSGISAFRNALVVGQLGLTVLFTVVTLAIMQQLRFMQHKNLGYEKDHVIIIHDTYALRPNNVNPFKNEVLNLQGVSTGTVSGYVPVEIENAGRNNNTFWEEGKEPTGENLVTFQRWSGDHDYIKTFGMKLLAGRDFSKDIKTDDQAVIINESAARQFGMKDPVGQRIVKFDVGTQGQEQQQKWTIIGVISDFHFTTMKEAILPLGIFLGNTDGSVSFRYKTDNPKELIAQMENVWKRLAPNQPFNYSFMENDFANMYQAEERLVKIFTLFSAMAIIIACLGLFALASFVAQQRTREIGIRKALGATVESILLLLLKDFGKLVLVAFIVFSPVAYFAVSSWLSSYAYNPGIGPSLYVIPAIIISTIAAAAVLVQSIRAATANPVASLRNE